jgi:hypothetical protein
MRPQGGNVRSSYGPDRQEAVQHFQVDSDFSFGFKSIGHGKGIRPFPFSFNILTPEIGIFVNADPRGPASAQLHMESCTFAQKQG